MPRPQRHRRPCLPRPRRRRPRNRRPRRHRQRRPTPPRRPRHDPSPAPVQSPPKINAFQDRVISSSSVDPENGAPHPSADRPSPASRSRRGSRKSSSAVPTAVKTLRAQANAWGREWFQVQARTPKQPSWSLVFHRCAASISPKQATRRRSRSSGSWVALYDSALLVLRHSLRGLAIGVRW
jgi:hypothetical protein